MSLGTVSIIIVCCVVVVIAAIVLYITDNEHTQNKLTMETADKDTGSAIHKIYYYFTSADPAAILERVGFNMRRYRKNCHIADIKPDPEKILVIAASGTVMAVVLTITAIFTKAWWLIGVGLVLLTAAVDVPIRKCNHMAAEKQMQIRNELPRFLDMLQTALYINMPVEKAIETTAQHLEDTLLAEEFERTLAEVRLGADSWQGALEKMSEKYDIDVFSDFVSDLVNAYNKGIPIYETVMRKNSEIKESQKLRIKENANKMNSTILFPIVVFKLVPILVLICLPIIIQMQNTM